MADKNHLTPEEVTELFSEIDASGVLDPTLAKKRTERMREKESQLRLLQASAKAVQQKAQHEAYDLDAQSQALEKRHVKEINGLAKQIQFLRARCLRAESFREALGYQKRFFLMQIQTYNEWYVDSTSNSIDSSMLTQLQQPGRLGSYLANGHYA